MINSKRQIGGDFVQIYMKPNEFDHARFGLIVSKKIEQCAVKRNRIKRILRDNFRLNRFRDAITATDWVVRVKRSVTREDSAKLLTEVQSLMMKLRQCHD